MLSFQPRCQPLMLGPLPHSDATEAWRIVLGSLPSLPVLPILAGAGETPTSLGVRGLRLYESDEYVLAIDRKALTQSLPRLDAAYLRGASDGWATELKALPWLHEHAVALRRSRALCGCIIGPISLAMQVVDDQGMPLAGDTVLVSALAQHLFLRRRWLYGVLKSANEQAVVWLYEPFAHTINEPFSPVPVDVFCMAVDQSLGYDQPRAVWVSDIDMACRLSDAMRIDLLGLPMPSVQHAEAFAPLLRRVLHERSGIGWGVVPSTSEDLAQMTVGLMAARFGEWLHALEHEGLSPDDVAAASFIMPQDTLAFTDVATAERVLAFTSELAAVIRHAYGVE